MGIRHAGEMVCIEVFWDESRLKNEMCEIVVCIPLGKDYYFSIIPIRKYQIPS